MSESIHVPRNTVKRAKAIIKLLVPVVLTAAATSVTTTVSWIRTRASVEDMRPLLKEEVSSLVDTTLIAKAGQAQAHTNHGDILRLQATTLQLASTVVELHAQAEVERAYGSNKRRNEYIERAKRFYARELERQLAAHPVNVAEAVRLTRLAVWRPDRDD